MSSMEEAQSVNVIALRRVKSKARVWCAHAFSGVISGTLIASFVWDIWIYLASSRLGNPMWLNFHPVINLMGIAMIAVTFCWVYFLERKLKSQNLSFLEKIEKGQIRAEIVTVHHHHRPFAGLYRSLRKKLGARLKPASLVIIGWLDEQVLSVSRQMQYPMFVTEASYSNKKPFWLLVAFMVGVFLLPEIFVRVLPPGSLIRELWCRTAPSYLVNLMLGALSLPLLLNWLASGTYLRMAPGRIQVVTCNVFSRARFRVKDFEIKNDTIVMLNANAGMVYLYNDHHSKWSVVPIRKDDIPRFVACVLSDLRTPLEKMPIDVIAER